MTQYKKRDHFPTSCLNFLKIQFPQVSSRELLKMKFYSCCLKLFNVYPMNLQ